MAIKTKTTSLCVEAPAGAFACYHYKRFFMALMTLMALMAFMTLMTFMTLMDTWILWSALVDVDLPWSAWAVLDHHRKA